MTIEQIIDKYEIEVYGGNMPPQNRQRLRDMLVSEDKFWEKEAVREDSNNSPVEGYFN